MKLSLIKALNHHVSMRDLLERADIEIPHNGQIFCPFHANTATRAAKFYDDGNSLWCFAEQKRYGAYDAMKLLQWPDAKMLEQLPRDIQMAEFEKDDDFKYKFPIVGAVLPDSYSSGAIAFEEYLFQLSRYWTHRDNLTCEEY